MQSRAPAGWRRKFREPLDSALGNLAVTEGTKRPEEFFKGSRRVPGRRPRITKTNVGRRGTVS